jgi:hypothetical protein
MHFPTALEPVLFPLQIRFAGQYQPNTAVQLNLLESTSLKPSASVDSKWLTKSLNFLESTLTKKPGRGEDYC